MPKVTVKGKTKKFAYTPNGMTAAQKFAKKFAKKMDRKINKVMGK